MLSRERTAELTRRVSIDRSARMKLGRVAIVMGFWVVALSSGTAQADDRNVTLKLSSQASYPFTCYDGLVNDDAGSEIIRGQITKIYYGYTQASLAEFQTNPNPAWLNSRGEPIAQGVIDISYHHNGLYKGAMVLPEISVGVPSGMNLVFRVSYLQRVGGSCHNSGDPLQTTEIESKVFFVRD